MYIFSFLFLKKHCIKTLFILTDYWDSLKPVKFFTQGEYLISFIFKKNFVIPICPLTRLVIRGKDLLLAAHWEHVL